MSLFDILTRGVFTQAVPPTPAATARDRLRIIVESSGQKSGVDKLKAMILDLIAKHANVDKHDVVVNIDKQIGKSVLELSVNIPSEASD